MDTKEQIIQLAFDKLTLFSGHLKAFENIPQQNFSAKDFTAIDRLKAGIEALDSIVIKAQNFSEESDEPLDLSPEKAAISLADETVGELENKNLGENVKDPLTKDDPTADNEDKDDDESHSSDDKDDAATEYVKKLLSDQKGDMTDEQKEEELEDFRPNIIDEPVKEAFFSYVDEYTMKNFGGYVSIGDKTISTDLGAWNKAADKKLDQYPISDKNVSLLEKGGKGFLIGLGLHYALSALKRNLDYKDYVKKCEEQGIEPINKSDYTIGNLENLKESAIIGGTLGASGNILRDHLETKSGKNFSLTQQDILDIMEYSNINAVRNMAICFSNQYGKKPDIESKEFHNWLNGANEIYFSELKDQFNRNINRVIDYSIREYPFFQMANFATMKDAVKGGAIGGLIGGLGMGAIEAIKKNKDYDMYAAQERAQGRVPISRAKWVFLSDEVLKKAGMGALGGVAAGSTINIIRNKDNHGHQNLPPAEPPQDSNNNNKKKQINYRNLNLLKATGAELEKYKQQYLNLQGKDKNFVLKSGKTVGQERDELINKIQGIEADMEGYSKGIGGNNLFTAQRDKAKIEDRIQNLQGYLSAAQQRGDDIFDRLKSNDIIGYNRIRKLINGRGFTPEIEQKIKIKFDELNKLKKQHEYYNKVDKQGNPLYKLTTGKQVNLITTTNRGNTSITNNKVVDEKTAAGKHNAMYESKINELVNDLRFLFGSAEVSTHRNFSDIILDYYKQLWMDKYVECFCNKLEERGVIL